MTLDEWLAARAGAVPAPLAASVRRALADDLTLPVSEAPERCTAAAEGIVAALLASGRTGRESALALLTADALATYAFEAAAGDPDRLAARSAAALRLLAGVE